MHYIYKITNILNQKIYVGQSKKPSIRWSQHKLQARKDNPSQVVNRAMKKYGVINFTFEVITCCLDQDAANVAEELIIKQENSQRCGYNLSNGGNTSPKTEAWKKMMHEHLKNVGFQPSHEVSEYVKMAVSVANTGRIHSKEELEKRTKSLKEYYRKNKIRRQMSESHKVAISKKHRACNLTQEQELELFHKLIAGKSQTSLSIEYNVNRKSVKRIFDKLSGETI